MKETRLEFDPRLVEEAVHLLALAAPDRWRTYRRLVDPLYEHPDREAAMNGALLDLFRRWGPAVWCEEAFSPIAGVESALVARSKRPGDEGADLFVGEHRTVIMRLAAERFLDQASLEICLRHELCHVLDMLDPSFGFERDLGVHGRTRAETELVRGRYRVLWNLAIDQVETPPVSQEARQRQMDRAFAALDPNQRASLAERFRDPGLRTHTNLVAAAREPWAFLGEPRRAGPVPGQPCPLCGFPTYVWADDPPIDAIRPEFPDWEPAAGACRQCADIYRAASAAGP